MKFLLISLNVIFAAAVVHLAWISVNDPVDFASRTKSGTYAGADKKKTSATRTRTKKQAAVTESPAATEKKIEALVKRNVFNTERVPDAPANRTAQRNNQQIRADMSLVGTYVIGDSLGAIILQRLQGNAQQQLKALQQKEYEQYQASATRITDPKKRAEAAAARAAGEDDADGAQAEDGDGKKVIIMGNPSISANNVFRQHLKVGDTTVNGYKLEEVTRTSAVLTKNNERIELSLLTPSEAGNIARQQRQNNNNNNRNQQNNNNNRNNNNNNNNRNNNNNNGNARNNNNNNRNNNNARNNNNNNRNNNNARNNNNNNRNNSRDDWEWF